MYIFQQDSEFGDDENEEEEEEEEDKEDEYETESEQPLNTTSNNKVSDNEEEEEEEEDDSSEDDSTEDDSSEDIATLLAPLKVYVAGTPDNGFNISGIKSDVINFGGTILKAKEVDGTCNCVVLGGKTVKARTASVFGRITRNDLWRYTVNQTYIRNCIKNRRLLPVAEYLINRPTAESINNVMYLYII